MNALPRRQLGRTDRHVRRGRLSLASDASPHKLALVAEESLRLCSLPGEEEGRVYYFRRLRVMDVPEDGDRRAWMNAFQMAMQEQASQALHGSHPRAAFADAVYFRNEQETCESLLMLYAVRRPAVDWYWPHVSGVTHDKSAPAQFTGVIQKLVSGTAGWSAAASVVLSVARRIGSAALIQLLPDEAIEYWLRGMGAADAAWTAPVRFSAAMTAIIANAIGVAGLDSPVVLWFATLAVSQIRPSSVQDRSAVRIARSSLHKMIAGASPPLPNTTLSNPPLPAKEPMCDSIGTFTALPAPMQAASDEEPQLNANALRQAGEPAVGQSVKVDQAETAPSIQDDFSASASRLQERVSISFSMFCAIFKFADQQPSLLFLAKSFIRIAAHSGIETADPILLWAKAVEARQTLEEIDERQLRVWLLRIRRWCWRQGRLTVREIVRRSGHVTLTRTHLDVTLSIDSADVRIRRIGLDLDPGWLPWFGRVVHFHYRYRGDIHG